MSAGKQEEGQRLWALFTDTPQLGDAERTEIAREAHKDASKLFRAAADDARTARDRFSYLLSIHLRESRGSVEPARLQLRAALDRLCLVPAVTKSQATERRALIGRIWMSAEGEQYDRWRQAVAADSAWLARQGGYSDRRMAGERK